MWIVVFDSITGKEIGRTWRLDAVGPEVMERIKAVDFAAPDGLTWASDQEPDARPLLAAIADGQVTSVEVDPEWQPGEPGADPVQARLEALEAVLARIPLNTPHNRRWLAQKERVKAVGIAHIQANPAYDQAQAEAAIVADLAAAFPGQPIVIAPGGAMLSYAAEAAGRGYISEASFAALRDLIAQSSASQIQAMLEAL